MNLAAFSLSDKKMQSPVTKGLLITVSALVAAGIAVYESPQFRQWMDNSRRKVAQTLHHLGDEIHPPSPSSSQREPGAMSQDISMTEDTSEAAEERRRAVREELERRSAALAARRRKSESGGSPASSFNEIVDKRGRLLDLDDEADAGGHGQVQVDTAGAGSTGVDLGSSASVVQRGATTTTTTSGRHSPDSDTLDMPGTPGTPAASSYTDANSFAELGSRASTPSTLSEFSQVHVQGEDARSGTATPADWSEVGSEISNEESRYY